MEQRIKKVVGEDRSDVLALDRGVVVYPPASTDGYWRLRWVELGKRRDTTARTEADAIAKAAELAERITLGAPTSHARAKGAALVEHYLDPTRRPARGRAWSERHSEAQESLCRRFVLPAIGTMAMQDMTRVDFQRILDSATTDTIAARLRQCLSAMVTAGLEEGLLLARQDVMRGVRRRPPAGEEHDIERVGPVDSAEIPTAEAVHNLARAAAERSGVWWRELEILLVAYSGLRWGEHSALTADQINPGRRTILVDRQVIETQHALKLSAPKSRRRRTTMYPAHTPGGVDLAALMERRLDELAPEGIVSRRRWATGPVGRTTPATSSTRRPTSQGGPTARRPPDVELPQPPTRLRDLGARSVGPAPAAKTCRGCSDTRASVSLRTSTSARTAICSTASSRRRHDYGAEGWVFVSMACAVNSTEVAASGVSRAWPGRPGDYCHDQHKRTSGRDRERGARVAAVSAVTDTRPFQQVSESR